MTYIDAVADYVQEMIANVWAYPALVYRGQIPDTSDAVVFALIPRTGRAPDIVHNDYDYLDFDLIGRSEDIMTADAIMQLLQNELQCKRHIVRGGIEIVSIITSPDRYVKMATKRRHEYIMRLNVTVVRSNNG